MFDEISKTFGNHRFTPSTYDDGRISTVGRPRDVRAGKPVLDYDNIYSIPYSPISYITLFQAMYLSFPWRFAIQTKLQEKYRKGLYVTPLFSAICDKCEKEKKGTGQFIETSPEQPCPNCQGELRGPDKDEKRLGDKWLNRCNLNKENVRDVMEEAHQGIEVIDDGYILLRKDYYFDKFGKIKYHKVKEIIAASPIIIRPIMENRTATPGGKYWVCPIHRNQVKERKRLTGTQYDALQQYPETEVGAPVCPEKGCNAVMKDVKYVSIFHERGRIENYYIDGEILHWKEFIHNKAFTFPPGVTLWVPSSIITYKDAYIRDSFMKQRKPRSFVAVMTANPNGFFRHWSKGMERVKNDWHYTPVIPFEPEPGMPSTGGSRVQVVDLMGTMKDNEYTEIRLTYERSIYQHYGIGNIFANLQTKSGSKTGDTELIISNRHVERSNMIDEEKPLAEMAWQLGMREWTFKIHSPEDRDQIKELNIQEHKDKIAQGRVQLGYDCLLDQHTGNWSWRKNPEQELTRAVNILNTILSFQSGNAQVPGMGGGPPGMDGQSMETNVPITDGNEFTGTAVDKAMADKQMHTGDEKPTPASSRSTTKDGPPYYAPDGAGPFQTKQQKGGYMRTKQNAGGTGATGGGQMSPEGAAGPLGVMGGYTKKQYEEALEILNKGSFISPLIMDLLEMAIGNIDESKEMDMNAQIPQAS